MTAAALAGEVTTVFSHEPVMLQETLKLVAEAAPKLVVDCTVGGGGHAAAILETVPETRLIGLDRDPQAVAAARQRLERFGPRARVVHARMSSVAAALETDGEARAGVVLADLGVSSHQLDEAERGFSFRAPGPLDMRMDPTAGAAAVEFLAEVEPGPLARILRELGEERYARRVARAVVDARPTTTIELAEVVRRVVPEARDGIDPATRTFQAIRMHINDELGELDAWLEVAPDVLADSGVLIAISFHSLEDRRVKRALRRAANPCDCPSALPLCVCGKQPVLEVLTSRPLRPTDDERTQNPRARSARLRAARRPRRAE